MSNKREYIVNNLKVPIHIVDVVMEYCQTIGSDKYSVWLAREAKKDEANLDYSKFRKIVDWAQRTNPNILSYNFSDAYNQSSTWHDELEKNSLKEFAKKMDIDENRIAYRCADNKHFFYRLKPSELKLEGKLMGHCVGGNEYAIRLKRKEIEILSLRDENNAPHVTIEIEKKTGISRQISGKGNKPPKDTYDKFISEYAIYMASDTDEDLKILKKLMKI